MSGHSSEGTARVSWEIRQGDCIESMRAMEPESVDAVVCDPPYGLGTEPDMAEVLTHWLAGDDYKHRGGGFMGKSWDSFVPGPAVWAEVLRVLKPGGHLLAFYGTRTYDLGVTAIRLVGFEIRDCLAWMYGSGFPKSLDVSKAIDKAAGAEREVVGTRTKAGMGSETTFAQDAWTQANRGPVELEITKPATAEAAEWQGWGTALKPSFEPIVMARKPLAGTVAGNVLEFGTGALNVDGCRVDTGGETITAGLSDPANRSGIVGQAWQAASDKDRNQQAQRESLERANAMGRWPANVILDEEAARLLDEQSGERQAGARPKDNNVGFGGVYTEGTTRAGVHRTERIEFDSGGASRFFYCAKASGAERGEGNTHPTVKPVALMQWLVRLVTPGGGLVLDPFAGSGSTGIAATREGFSFIGLEREAEYVAIARRRILDDAPLLNSGTEVAA